MKIGQALNMSLMYLRRFKYHSVSITSCNRAKACLQNWKNVVLGDERDTVGQHGHRSVWCRIDAIPACSNVCTSSIQGRVRGRRDIFARGVQSMAGLQILVIYVPYEAPSYCNCNNAKLRDLIACSSQTFRFAHCDISRTGKT